MPNTFEPTFMPQAIAEGPLAVIQEDEVVLALEDVTVDALSTDLPAGMLSFLILDKPLIVRRSRRRRGPRSRTSPQETGVCI